MSLTAYPSYKDSGVPWLGQVPKHWEVKRLKHIAPNAVEKIPPSADLGYVGLENIESWTGRQLASDEPMTPEAESNSFTCGDVLFGKLRPYLAKCIVAKTSGICSSELLVLRPRSAEPRFLQYTLLTQEFIHIVDGSTFGSKMPRADWHFIGNCQLPLPPLAEQRAIAGWLDGKTGEIDAAVAAQRTLLEQLKEKRRALIAHAVTRGLDPAAPLKDSGIPWLGRVPQHWEVKKFSHEIEIQDGLVDPTELTYEQLPLIAPNHVESGTGRLSMLESAKDQSAESGKYLCRTGDVVYSKIRPALAKATIAPCECLCSADMYPMRSRGRFNHRYLAYMLISEPFTAWVVLESDRVAMPKVNRDSLGRLGLPTPPLAEQQAIAAYLDAETAKLDTLTAETEKTLALLAEHRTALIAAAVTGKLRVPGVPA